MMGIGFSGILFLGLLAGNATTTDIVGMITPADYFKVRQIDITIEKAIDLASQDPKDPKTQIMQLTALRYLADESDNLKKHKEATDLRQRLEAIAQGKKANDAEGFAADYANRVLLKLDNKKAEPLKLPPLREDGLAWFPADTTIGGAFDLRLARQGNTIADPLKDLLKIMPEREKKEMYDVVEKIGNVRIDRAAFGYVDTGKRETNKIFVRFSGKANQKWLSEAFTQFGGRMQVKEHKDDKEKAPILLMQDGNRAPVIMFVGNTDLVIFGYTNDNMKHDDLLNDVLQARSGKKPNAGQGVLKERLKKVPDKAVAMLAGEIPTEMKQMVGFLFDPIPPNILAFIERAQQGLDVQIEATMANNEDANKTVQKISALRKQGIAAVQQAMQAPNPGGPQIPWQGLINLMESLQVQNTNERVQVRVVIPDGLLSQLPALFLVGRAIGN